MSLEARKFIIIPGGAEQTPVFGEVTGVAAKVETDVVTFVFPGPDTAYVPAVNFSGTNRAKWKVKKNGTTFDQKYIQPTDLGGEFVFSGNISRGVVFDPGDTITVTAEHPLVAEPAAFNATVRWIM